MPIWVVPRGLHTPRPIKGRGVFNYTKNYDYARKILYKIIRENIIAKKELGL